MAMRHTLRAFRPVLATLALVAGALLAGCGSSTTPVTPVPETPLDSLILSITADTLQTGQTRTITVTAIDTSGAPLSNPAVRWRSSNAAVATVNSAGVVSAAAEGLAWIVGEYGGQADSASVFVYATGGWVVQTSNTINNLNGVCFRPDGRRGWAVGDAGTLVRTTNAGVTWDNSTISTFALNGVWFTSDLAGWAVGAGGTVLRTADGGATWTRLTNVPASGAAVLNDVHFVTPAYGWIVGGNGLVLRTRDGGASWTAANPSVFELHSVSFADTTNGWAVGDNGTILGTRDVGASWFVVPGITAQSLRGVSRVSALNAWAAGQQGVTPFTRLVTATPADTVGWQLDNVGAGYGLEGVHFPTAQVGYVVGFNVSGAILRTSNGGTTWTPQVSNTGQRLLDVWFVDEQRGWAVGESGRIVHTGRGGQ